MSKAIIKHSGPVTLLGGGQVSATDLADALTIAPILVAVDGGLVTAQAAGVDPVAVIGDMDSAPPDALVHVPDARLHRLSEQQTTDFDKALRAVDTPVALGVGFCGGRVDHQLAAFHTLLVHRGRPCILIAQHEIIVLAPPALTLDTQAGDIVSLFPLVAVQGSGTGLEWPIDGLGFDPEVFVGTSNRATGRLSLSMQKPGMLLIVPRRHLEQMVEHFVQGGARWDTGTPIEQAGTPVG
jgi:thiamine pyrophosphokinase